MSERRTLRSAAVARLFVATVAVVATVAPAFGATAAPPGSGACAAAAASTPVESTRPDDPANATPESGGSTRLPAILSVYPNPVRNEDRGEFVVVVLPAAGNWTLGDGEGRVPLPANASGRVVLTAVPGAVPPVVNGTVVAWPGAPALANGGETLRLRRNGTVVDAVTYVDAPEGERYRPGTGFEPLAATDFAVYRTGPTDVTAFALPDAPDVAVELLRSAERRILLAAYTLTSRRVADALVAAARRGVEVRVLVEGGPVGGTSRRQARLLDRIAKAGAQVRVVGGPRARYRYHHAKYAVVDDRALVTSENWKPSGVGGRSSRGWGAVVHDAAVAARLAAVFRADAGWRDARPWKQVRASESFQPPDVVEAEYPSRFAPKRLRAESVAVVVAPDNAERAVVSLVRSACETVLVQQMAIGGRRSPFLRAALSAARRGVEVRILLSSAWYVREGNRRLVEWLNRRAEAEGLPLEARLAEPGDRYGKVHNKGVVVDGERALVGSLNWNNNSARNNREVALVVEGEAAAGYYARVFRTDWRGGRRYEVPAGLLLVVVLAAVVAVRWGYERIEFE